MKTNQIIVLIGIMCTCAFAKAQTSQTKEKSKTQNNLPANGNLLDQQAQVLGNIFGDLGGMEEMKGIDGYMDLLKKSDLSPELKTKFTEQYQLISLSDDPKKKKEMQLKLSEMLQKAFKEGQEKDALQTKGH